MADRKHYPIIQVYHDLVKERGGALPTTREIADLSGAVVGYVRKALEREGLPYHKQSSNTAALAANLRKRAEKDAIFREKHASMTRSAGRYPTRVEMNMAMGYQKGSSMGGEIARRLGLALTAERKRKEKPPEKKVELPPVVPERDFGHRATPSMLRIMEIREGTGLGEGKGWGHSPSEGYGVTDRKMITCPVCGARRLIAPRMHPFWLRDKQGKVVFVCSRGCTGQTAT